MHIRNNTYECLLNDYCNLINYVQVYSAFISVYACVLFSKSSQEDKYFVFN